VTEPSTDFYAVDDLLEPEEIEIRDRVRAFCEQEVTPHINGYWERGSSRSTWSRRSPSSASPAAPSRATAPPA